MTEDNPQPSSRVVDGITLDEGVPIPANNPSSPLGRAIAAMKVGESFLCDTESQLEKARAQATKRGIKICRRKIPGEGWRVWRLA